MENYQQMAINAGVKDVDYVIDYGSPKVKIPKDIAKKYNIDLIMCGATGLNAVERFFIGSVSEHITRYASCDVLIVRTEEETL
jgi:nucleotide-binding universal stress UspA family protein